VYNVGQLEQNSLENYGEFKRAQARRLKKNCMDSVEKKTHIIIELHYGC